MRKNVFFIACFIILAADCFSQIAESRGQLPFINYTPADGLVNNRVRSIYQDGKGRLYFLTFGGLSMYDGARFTNYTITEGLGNDVVNDILEINSDSLLIATNDNQFYCLAKGKIKPLKTSNGFYPVINSFFKSNTGAVYVAAEEGLLLWKDQRFNRLPMLYKGNDVGKYFMKIQAAGNFLLLLTNPEYGDNPGVLFLYDLVHQKIVYAETQFITFSTSLSPDGNIWLCTTRGIRVLKKEILQQGIFKAGDVPPNFSVIQNKKASFLKFDSQGQLWASIFNKGLLFIKPGAAPVQYNEASGLASRRISTIFQDKEGNYWFVPGGKGVQKLVNNSIEFMDHPFEKGVIDDLSAELPSDSVWLYDGIEGKLILSDRGIRKFFQLPFPPMHNGHLIAKGSVIYLYDEKNIYRIKLTPNHTKLDVTLIYKDLSLQVGYGIIDPYDNLIYYADNQLRVFQKNKITFSYTSEYYSDQPSLDKTGHLWIATRTNKLQAFTLHPEDPTHYLQPQNDIPIQLPLKNPRSLVVDDSGKIWIGTRFDGLYCFRFAENTLTQLHHFTRKEGLTDNFINYLSCDHNNDIWASSPAGLDKLEINHLLPVILNVTRSNHLFLSFQKVMTDKSGTTWALGEGGNLLKVYTQTKSNPEFTPILQIAQIKTDRDFFTDVESIHDFSYRQNNLTFSISAPSFYDEKQIKYSYLMTGSGNNHWSEASGIADLNFVNLSPGKYTLRIKADFPAARYPSQITDYTFTIHPPWWQTWWFRIIIGLIIIALLIAATRSYYQRKLEKQKNILEKKEAIEKERNRIATDMHDDLGAGLSTIRFLSEKVKRNSFSDVTKTDIDKIVFNSNDLVQKMNEIIWTMNEKNDTLEDLLFYTRSYAVEYCEENNLLCETHIPETVPAYFVSGEIRRNVFLTIKESLHNIIKHAAAKLVVINFEIDKNLVITVKDDGTGMPENRKPEGNGLRNMQKRIESVSGTFDVQNKNGVIVKMSIPLPV